jgi:hypothetical protein
MYHEVAATFYSVEFLSRLYCVVRVASRELGGRGGRRFIRELGYWNQKVHPQGMFMKHGKVNKGAH